MATKKIEKKEELGTQIQLGAIIKNAQKKKEDNIILSPVSTIEKKIYTMVIKVPKTLWNKFSNSYYELIKELGDKYVSITRTDVFVHLITYMDKNIDIDTSEYPDLYDQFIGKKGKRATNERSLNKGIASKNFCWAKFFEEDLAIWKRLLTKLAIQEGVERRIDFSKQYFIFDIVHYFEQNTKEIAQYIKEKNKSNNKNIL